MKLFRRSKKKRIWTGVALGVTGGLAGSWLMNQSVSLMEKVAKSPEPNPSQPKQEPATALTAEMISESVLGSPLPPQKKKMAEPLVHYAFGALVGALYGGLATASPAITRGAGMLYGAAVWLLADEVAVPAFGLSKPPTEVSPAKHIEALGAHLVYGLTTEGVRRAGMKFA